MKDSTTQKFAIRFGLGAIKAVGINAMEEVTKERNKNGKFKNIYDFAKRLDPKFINKKPSKPINYFFIINLRRNHIIHSTCSSKSSSLRYLT